MAAERNYRVRFVTIPELANILFDAGRIDERRIRHA
jgi:hypothetical protein